MGQIGKCKFINQPCHKESQCFLLQGETDWLTKTYHHTRELAEKVALHNCKILAPYCMWKEDYHYYVYNFSIPRPRCKCGEDAYWWDGEKSLCGECLERQEDFKQGYAFNSEGTKIVSLREKYGGVNDRGKGGRTIQIEAK